MKKTAIAFFVKTPGDESIKTRLAKQVGIDVANTVYELSLNCVQSLACKLQNEGIDVIWAVAEKESINSAFWLQTGLETMYSGDGELGDCLHNVYAKLFKVADNVVLLGSDSPQLTVADIKPAWEIEHPEYLIGPAKDGGFYMFVGREEISKEIWTSVKYSTETTLDQLERKLDKPIKHLEVRTDFDDIDSLSQVLDDMPNYLDRAQEKFYAYASNVVKLFHKNYKEGSAKNIS